MDLSTTKLKLKLGQLVSNNKLAGSFSGSGGKNVAPREPRERSQTSEGLSASMKAVKETMERTSALTGLPRDRSFEKVKPIKEHEASKSPGKPVGKQEGKRGRRYLGYSAGDLEGTMAPLRHLTLTQP